MFPARWAPTSVSKVFSPQLPIYFRPFIRVVGGISRGIWFFPPDFVLTFSPASLLVKLNRDLTGVLNGPQFW